MNVLNNRFFKFAIDRATRMAGKPARILNVIAQLSLKLNKSHFKNINAASIKEQFLLIGRMVKASVLGKYKIQSPRVFIILLAAIIYFLNPLDLIPDFIPALGLTDDLAVLAWVYQAAYAEVQAFQKWEAAQLQSQETVM